MYSRQSSNPVHPTPRAGSDLPSLADEVARENRSNALFKDRQDMKSRTAVARQPLFPIGLPPASARTDSRRERKSLWPEEAQEISRSLKPAIDLAKLTGGLVIDEQSDQFDDAARPDRRSVEHLSAWRRPRPGSFDTNPATTRSTINWASETERGVFSPAYELALVRKSAPTDLPQVYEAERVVADRHRVVAIRIIRWRFNGPWMARRSSSSSTSLLPGTKFAS